MKQRPRIYYSAEQKNLMWDRWQAGDSLHEIARLFDRGHSSVQGVFAETGGISPRPRSRSRLALTLAERNARRSHEAWSQVGLFVLSQLRWVEHHRR